MGGDDEPAVAEAAHLFDHSPRAEWTQRFLDDPGHHLCLAYVDGHPAGFISGVEIAHPDKGVEMLLYEMAVDEPYRRQGIASALVAALADRARERGGRGMWVLTEPENEAAQRTYRSTGASDSPAPVMFEWTFAVG